MSLFIIRDRSAIQRIVLQTPHAARRSGEGARDVAAMRRRRRRRRKSDRQQPEDDDNDKRPATREAREPHQSGFPSEIRGGRRRVRLFRGGSRGISLGQFSFLNGLRRCLTGALDSATSRALRPHRLSVGVLFSGAPYRRTATIAMHRASGSRCLRDGMVELHFIADHTSSGGAS